LKKASISGQKYYATKSADKFFFKMKSSRKRVTITATTDVRKFKIDKKTPLYEESLSVIF
jgi:hypothetical protein